MNTTQMTPTDAFLVILDCQEQDAANAEAGEMDARLSDPVATIRGWLSGAAEAGDERTVEAIELLGVEHAARIYAASGVIPG